MKAAHPIAGHVLVRVAKAGLRSADAHILRGNESLFARLSTPEVMWQSIGLMGCCITMTDFVRGAFQ